MTSRQRIKLAVAVDFVERAYRTAINADARAAKGIKALGPLAPETRQLVESSYRLASYKHDLADIARTLDPLIDELRQTFKLPRTL